jgi:hypothetical protein
MSSHSLLRFAVGSILLGCCVASAQAQRGGAYPMNTGDRINATSGNSDDSGYDDNGRSITAAGAYPMSTMDRINSGWREHINSIDRVNSARSFSRRASPDTSTVRSDPTKTSGVAEAAPSLKDRPDAWRYRWHRNQWWYYGANNQWSYWTGNHWNAYQTAAAASNDLGN